MRELHEKLGTLFIVILTDPAGCATCCMHAYMQVTCCMHAYMQVTCPTGWEVGRPEEIRARPLRTWPPRYEICLVSSETFDPSVREATDYVGPDWAARAEGYAAARNRKAAAAAREQQWEPGVGVGAEGRRDEL